MAQDLANQIRHWDVYVKEVQKHATLTGPGMFLSPSAAEWFSGAALQVYMHLEFQLMELFFVFRFHFLCSVAFLSQLQLGFRQVCLQAGPRPIQVQFL